MGVALLGFAQSKKNVSNRKSFIHSFGKVCAKFRGYLKICRHISINDWTTIHFKETTEKSFEEYHKQIYIKKTVSLFYRISRMALDPVNFESVEYQLGETDAIKFSDKFQRAAFKTLLMDKDKQGEV